jgi:hypothetical protein
MEMSKCERKLLFRKLLRHLRDVPTRYPGADIHFKVCLDAIKIYISSLCGAH